MDFKEANKTRDKNLSLLGKKVRLLDAKFIVRNIIIYRKDKNDFGVKIFLSTPKVKRVIFHDDIEEFLSEAELLD